MKRSFSRRDAFRALATGAPALAIAPLAAQSTTDEELAAAERRLNAAIESLRRFPLPADAEPAAIFRA